MQEPEDRRSSPGHEAVGLDAMLEAVELPAGIPHLDARLSYVDADDLPQLLSLWSAALLFCRLRSSESVYQLREEAASQKREPERELQDRDRKGGGRGRGRAHSDLNRSLA